MVIGLVFEAAPLSAFSVPGSAAAEPHGPRCAGHPGKASLQAGGWLGPQWFHVREKNVPPSA